MRNDSTTSVLGKTVSALTAALVSTKALAEAEARCGSVASWGLIAAVEEALGDLTALRMDALRDELAALPPIAGGGHDDFEVIDPDFERCPETWPDVWHAEIDGYVYSTDPTPLSVLAESDPDFDWDLDPSRWDALESRWSESDQIALHGTW